MFKIVINDKETGIQKEVQIARTLSGDYILKEHPNIDIIVMPQKSKVLVLAKEEQNDQVYYIQDKLMTYLTKRGVILPESVIAGNVYGSLQASFVQQPPGGENPVQVVTLNIANFIEDERPIFKFEKDFEDKMEKDLLKPNIENSTELGEVPQEPFKGSIPKYGFPTRGIYRYNY
jgi:hypothetical protein